MKKYVFYLLKVEHILFHLHPLDVLKIISPGGRNYFKGHLVGEVKFFIVDTSTIDDEILDLEVLHALLQHVEPLVLKFLPDRKSVV